LADLNIGVQILKYLDMKKPSLLARIVPTPYDRI
jgi:hypothetical protein